ncbi:GIY-YIG nuclease family protein [Croceimicrobium hydrocarbonivorans]|uniref:GIY-YIG nuclease family protein n=1 Tax=Croceimicrobium hydrocarbonivorans TaxID=2761580 RepID=A0A7H0VB36_9FLAO|nr:GIY-YIG nuclease family protein [Croceimicrobium hydrocarbonivorans]QNR22934.1 GIY-YIG nuclease family protein [Croceimicrobium hydrocarbonivorans]
MYVTYVLYSFKYNRLYIGYTSDLINRFKSHQQLATKGFTVKYRPWFVIEVCCFNTKKEAMEKENYFKSGHGRDFIRNQILPRYF